MTTTPARPQITTCLHGHDFDEANTYWRKVGTRYRRQCRRCRADRKRRYHHQTRDQRTTTTRIVLDNQPSEPIPTGEWQPHAACHHADPNDFTAQDEEPGIPARARKAADTWCAHCPVFAACHLDATHTREIGLWGGIWRTTTTYGTQYRMTVLVDEWRKGEAA